MKRIFLALLFISSISFSQTLESLKVATKKLYAANYLMDFETITSLSYPKMVETIGKDAFLEELEKYYENEAYRLREQLETLAFQYGEIKKIGGKSFCVITFRNPVRYFVEEKIDNEAVALMHATMLEGIDNNKEVVFEPKRNSFKAVRATTYLAIIDENTSNEWKFFNFDDSDQSRSFRSLFNETIQKELGL